MPNQASHISEQTDPQPSFEELSFEVSRLRAELEHAGQVPHRRHLPDTRKSLTHKFSISGHEGYLTVGMYEDGSPGEVFIKMAKEGSTISGLVDTIAILTSMALQYGVPVENLARKFEHTRFEPSGHTTNRDIPEASSVPDYVFRWLARHFPQPGGKPKTDTAEPPPEEPARSSS